MAISSNTLFHFTPKLSYLEKILSDGFWPRYCREYAWGGYDYAIPMVCFCDIPLSQISKHIDKYGGYGIGVTKKWAAEEDVTPVMYIKNSTSFYKRVDNDMKNIVEKKKEPTPNELLFLHYIKKVAGETIVTEKDAEEREIKKIISFYDEREWRYIPIGYIFGGQYHLEFIKRDAEFDKDNFSEKTKEYKIKPCIEDVRYLIVKDDFERVQMIKFINKQYKDCDEKERALLMSRILSVKQIKDDF